MFLHAWVHVEALVGFQGCTTHFAQGVPTDERDPIAAQERGEAALLGSETLGKKHKPSPKPGTLFNLGCLAKIFQCGTKNG